jgi:HNH endonuclease
MSSERDMIRNKLTAERLRELLRYDPKTGVFTWLVLETKNQVKAGDVAGYINNGGKGGGYLKIRVDGHGYRAHRLAWLYMTGTWPHEQIDHIDRNRANNRWCNLREATQAQNQANSRLRKARDFKGAYFHKCSGKLQAAIQSNGRQIHLGLFDTPEQAWVAYAFAAWKYHGAYAQIDTRYIEEARILCNLADLSIYADAA